MYGSRIEMMIYGDDRQADAATNHLQALTAAAKQAAEDHEKILAEQARAKNEATTAAEQAPAGKPQADEKDAKIRELEQTIARYKSERHGVKFKDETVCGQHLSICEILLTHFQTGHRSRQEGDHLQRLSPFRSFIRCRHCSWRHLLCI